MMKGVNKYMISSSNILEKYEYEDILWIWPP